MVNFPEVIQEITKIFTTVSTRKIVIQTILKTQETEVLMEQFDHEVFHNYIKQEICSRDVKEIFKHEIIVKKLSQLFIVGNLINLDIDTLLDFYEDYSWLENYIISVFLLRTDDVQEYFDQVGMLGFPVILFMKIRYTLNYNWEDILCSVNVFYPDQIFLIEMLPINEIKIYVNSLLSPEFRLKIASYVSWLESPDLIFEDDISQNNQLSNLSDNEKELIDKLLDVKDLLLNVFDIKI